jgi:hypothetical protein
MRKQPPGAVAHHGVEQPISTVEPHQVAGRDLNRARKFGMVAQPRNGIGGNDPVLSIRSGTQLVDGLERPRLKDQAERVSVNSH